MCGRVPWLARIPWRRVIVDKTHAIKNAGTRHRKAVRKLKGASRIALTGTPIKNSLDALWALFDSLFVLRGINAEDLFPAGLAFTHSAQSDALAEGDPGALPGIALVDDVSGIRSLAGKPPGTPRT